MIIKVYRKLRTHSRRFIDKKLPDYFYRSGFLSSLYYSLFSSEFRREHQAVLSGKVAHRRNEKNYFTLVRNTHRLEKALLMKPRRPVFGTRYIRETVEIFTKVYSHTPGEQTAQLKWIKDVLSEYFEVVQNDPEIDRQRKIFTGFIGRSNTSEVGNPVPSIPYHRRIEQQPPVSYEEFFQLTKQRRSVRWFLDRPVPRELIDKAILAANQSPSACNRQPFEYRIFDDRKMLSKVTRFPMGTKGYAQNIPVLLVVVGNLDAYFSERDRHLIYVDASLANMSLMLALETLGLSSCPINWPDIEPREKEMEEFLKLKKFQRPIMCIGIGYPDMEGKVAYSEKRSLEELRTYNDEL